MSSTLSRVLKISAAAALCAMLTAPRAMAQQGAATPEATKTPKAKPVPVSLHGSLTIGTGEPCANGTSIDTCYPVSAPALMKGKNPGGSMTGTMEVSSNPVMMQKGPCYAIVNASTESLTVESGSKSTTAPLNFSGIVCVFTNKKGTSEVLNGAQWENSASSPFKGTGKESWKVSLPASSTASPLSGTGPILFTGKLM